MSTTVPSSRESDLAMVRDAIARFDAIGRTCALSLQQSLALDALIRREASLIASAAKAKARAKSRFAKRAAG